MNKILQSASSGDINITNDGATILKAIQLDNAAAKILVNISKVQDDEVGDGTTSVTVLAAELLREAEKLIGQKIHPQTIVEGYRIASTAALKALEGAAVDHRCVCYSFTSWEDAHDAHRTDQEKFRQDLFNIARTTLSSKVLSQDKDYFANLAVDAVLRLKVRHCIPDIQSNTEAFGRAQQTSSTFRSSKRSAASSPTRTWTRVSVIPSHMFRLLIASRLHP